MAWLSGLSAANEPKGSWFNSQSGHKARLPANALVGGIGEATNRCVSYTSMFPSLAFPAPPLSLKVNKWVF